MDGIKKLGKIIFTTAVSTFTSCVVRDIYKECVHDDIVKMNLKEKIKNFNPFCKAK